MRFRPSRTPSPVLTLALVITLMLFLPAISSALSVDEAYRAIPHRRTPFVTSQAKMPAKDKAYLKQLFRLVDQAMVHRVTTLLWFQTSGQRGQSVDEYKAGIAPILNRLRSLKPPSQMVGTHRLIMDAIAEQRDYFSQWEMSYNQQRRFNPRHASVQRAHKKLLKAYGYLMRHYSREGPQNQQAFYDHLCALDFL